MELAAPPPTATVDQITAYERSRGASDWTGQQGANDAWLIAQQFWNRDTYGFLAGCQYVNGLLGRIG